MWSSNAWLDIYLEPPYQIVRIFSNHLYICQESSTVVSILLNIGRLACKLYENMRREAAAVKIQKNLRRYFARKSFLLLRSSAIALQTGLRAMTARNDFRFKKQTKASIHIQVMHSLFKLFHDFILF